MSNIFNDQIADSASESVDRLTDHEVLSTLWNNHGIASPINGDGFRAETFMDKKRDQLKGLVFTQMLEMGGPHG